MLGRIIQETKDDLVIHEFPVPPGSIMGRLWRKSAHVQALGGNKFRELEEPLVATINARRRRESQKSEHPPISSPPRPSSFKSPRKWT